MCALISSDFWVGQNLIDWILVFTRISTLNFLNQIGSDYQSTPTEFKTRLNSSNELIKKLKKKKKRPVPSGKSTCNLVLSFIASYLVLGLIILKENNKIVKNDKERNASFGKSMVTWWIREPWQIWDITYTASEPLSLSLPLDILKPNKIKIKNKNNQNEKSKDCNDSVPGNQPHPHPIPQKLLISSLLLSPAK